MLMSMKIDEDERKGRAIRALVMIAFALLFIGFIGLGMSQHSKTGLYAQIGVSFLLGSLVVFLVAGAIWSFNWIREHVKIE